MCVLFEALQNFVNICVYEGKSIVNLCHDNVLRISLVNKTGFIPTAYAMICLLLIRFLDNTVFGHTEFF